jgi:hypothetical protein
VSNDWIISEYELKILWKEAVLDTARAWQTHANAINGSTYEQADRY